jgi:lipid-A-disaccharide synthase
MLKQPGMVKIYLIAGEASGDLLGAHLMRELKAQAKLPLKCFGVGGDKMAAEGLNSLFPFHELSMLGFLEVLPHAHHIFARVSQTVDDILAKQPDVVVTIDVPGFNLRVVERLRKRGYQGKFVHYVAPTVWAYKPQRAALCARLFDHMLLLLPFEPPYFEKVGLPCTFVGHPVVAETSMGNGNAFREKYQISADTPLFAMLPGSRKGEIARHMPIFAQAMTLLAARYPKLALAVTVPRHVLPLVAPYFQQCPFRAVVTADPDDKLNAFAASQCALVKSGTVALEVAKAGTPMVVAYRVNPISAYVFRRISLTRYVNLINILLDREAIPELLQELCTPPTIADALATLMDSPDARRQQLESAATALAAMRGPDEGLTPSARAARVVLSGLAD